MKKMIQIFSVLLLIASLASCDRELRELTDNVDLNMTASDSYNTIATFFANPADYTGKTAAIKAESSVIYSFSKNKVTHIMLGKDSVSGKKAYYKISAADGKYPAIGTEAVFAGLFNDKGYMELTGFKGQASASDQYDLDALDMTAVELDSFIKSFKENCLESEYSGKTIRIFGHLEKQGDYYYFLGFDENGKQTWHIEVYEPTGKLTMPLAAELLLNPVELIGELTTYEENGIYYACIRVAAVTSVEGTFK